MGQENRRCQSNVGRGYASLPLRMPAHILLPGLRNRVAHGGGMSPLSFVTSQAGHNAAPNERIHPVATSSLDGRSIQ